MTFELESRPNGWVVIRIQFTDGSHKNVGVLAPEHVGVFLEALRYTRSAYLEMGRLGL